MDDYDRAEALWGKWCDVKRVECPRCHGDGEFWEGDYPDDDYLLGCPKCYGTGKVRPPTPPSRYTIVNGGVLRGWHRALVMKDDALYYMCQSSVCYDHARANAAAFVRGLEGEEAVVAAAERDE
jgi:hypothetical protein